MVLCCFPIAKLSRDQDMPAVPCKCHTGNLPDMTGAVVTPVAVVMGHEDTLSALPASPGFKKTYSFDKVNLRKTKSMVDQTSLSSLGTLSGLPTKRRAQSLTAIDKIKADLGVVERRLSTQSQKDTEKDTEKDEEKDKEKDEILQKEEEGESSNDLPKNNISNEQYLSMDIEELKARKTSTINYSSGYAVKLG